MAGNSGGLGAAVAAPAVTVEKKVGVSSRRVGKINLKAVIPYHLKSMTCSEKGKSNFAF